MLVKTKDRYTTMYRYTNIIHNPHRPAVIQITDVQSKETDEFMFNRVYVHNGVRHNIVGFSEISHTAENSYYINGRLIG